MWPKRGQDSPLVVIYWAIYLVGYPLLVGHNLDPQLNVQCFQQLAECMYGNNEQEWHRRNIRGKNAEKLPDIC